MSKTDSVSLPYEEIAAAMEAAAAPGELTQHLIDTDWWSDQDLAAAGIPVVDIPFVCLGGGIGWFVMVAPAPDRRGVAGPGSGPGT